MGNAVHVVVAGDVFDGVLFSHEMSWMRYGAELSQFNEDFSYLLLTSLNREMGSSIWLW